MDLCVKFLQNPTIHPETGEPLTQGSPEYNKLILKCGFPSTNLRAFPGTIPKTVVRTRLGPPIPTPSPTMIPLPIPLPKPLPALQNRPNEYIQRQGPTPDDFAINAFPENSEYIQAAIQTGREIYPSLEFYIQIAERIIEWNRNHNIDDDGTFALLHRSNYPFFMRDASPFEIFKIYKGQAAETGRILIKWVLDSSANALEAIIDFLHENNFTRQYHGIIRTTTLDRYNNLNPETFRAAITPDQAILMEGWRKRVLTDHKPHRPHNSSSILNLAPVLRQLRENRANDNGNRFRINGLKHFQTGFDREDLYRAIIAANGRLNPMNQTSNITVDYLRYEGEEAIDQLGRNRSHSKIPIHDNFPKEYYMMVYNELLTRGVITVETERQRRIDEAEQQRHLYEAKQRRQANKTKQK